MQDIATEPKMSASLSFSNSFEIANLQNSNTKRFKQNSNTSKFPLYSRHIAILAII